MAHTGANTKTSYREYCRAIQDLVASSRKKV